MLYLYNVLLDYSRKVLMNCFLWVGGWGILKCRELNFFLENYVYYK